MLLRIVVILFAWVVMMLPEIAIASDALVKAPPRTIDDVLKVLDRKSSDVDPLGDAKALVAKTISDSAGNDEKNLFYRTRAEAYARLGQLDKAISDLEVAVDKYPGRSNIFKTSDLQTLATYEAAVGNLNKAIALNLRARALIRNNELGMFMSNDNALLSNYAELGDFAEAERYLSDANATLTMLRRAPVFARLGNFWTAQLMFSNATYLSYQGRWSEAETYLKKSLPIYKDWLVEIQAHPYNTSGADPSSDPIGTAFITRNVIGKLLNTQNLLAKSLAMQGKLVEAEVLVRESLELNLSYFGRNTIQAGNGLIELSGVLAEQRRFAEANMLATKALEIYKAAGANDGALGVLKAKRSLARYLVGERRFVEADKLFSEINEQIERTSGADKKNLICRCRLGIVQNSNWSGRSRS